ncbi:regulating synaptic membrane exocytosis protein 1 isoform X10 [Tachysurus ichikawai]
MAVRYKTRTLHQQFESYKEQVRRIGVDNKRQQTTHKDDAPTCGICRKTKFADGCGHLCSYCQTKFCARCGGRVSLRSNNHHGMGWHIFSSCRNLLCLKQALFSCFTYLRMDSSLVMLSTNLPWFLPAQ